MADQRASILLELRQEGVSEIAAIQAKIGELMTQAKGWISLRQEDAISLDKYLEGMKLYEKVIGALATTYGRLTEARDKDATAAAKQQERDAKEAQAQMDRAEEVWRRQSLAIEKAEEKRDAAAIRQLERGAKEAQAQIDQAEEVWRRQSLAIDKAEEKRDLAAERGGVAWARANAKWLEDNDAAVAHYLANLLKEEGATEATAVKEGLARARENAKWLEDNDAVVARYVSSQTTATKSVTTGYHNIGFAMLSVGNAIQDLQYGFGAVVNNIPLIVMGLGGGMGLAGTLITVGVAVNLLIPELKQMGKALGVLNDDSNLAGWSLGTLKDKLHALEEKPFKMQVDYQDIQDAKDKIEELTEAEAAFKAGKKTATERYMKELGAELVKEVPTGLMAKGFRAQDETVGKDRADPKTVAWLAAARAQLANAMDNPESPGSELAAKRNLAAAEAQAEKERKAYYDVEMAGKAAEGMVPQLGVLRQVAQDMPHLFTPEQRQAIFKMPYEQKMAEELTPNPAKERAAKNFYDKQQKENRAVNQAAAAAETFKNNAAMTLKGQKDRDANAARMQSAREQGAEQDKEYDDMKAFFHLSHLQNKHDATEKARAEKNFVGDTHRLIQQTRKMGRSVDQGQISQDLQRDWNVPEVLADRAAPKIEQMKQHGYNPVAAAMHVLQDMWQEQASYTAELESGMMGVQYRGQQAMEGRKSSRTRRRTMMPTNPSSDPR